MKSLQPEPRPRDDVPWSWRKWWIVVLIAFAAHLGLLFALGDRQPLAQRPSDIAPTLRLTKERGEIFAVNDPTLFALPHAHGFAAPAWLNLPKISPPAFAWTEPPRWLSLSPEELGDTFSRYMQTNVFARFELDPLPPPEWMLPELPTIPAAPARSELRIEGDLSLRQLVNPPELEPQPAGDLLTNTVVQVVVNAAGRVQSVAQLCPPGSGSKAADQWALKFAREARFTPLPDAGISAEKSANRITTGLLVFKWHTVPLSATNTPASLP